MIKNPFFNEMVLVGEKKSRKGDGATAILNLMASTLDFLDKVDTCIEAVTHSANKQKLEGYKAQVESMYTEMAEMSKSAIREITNGENPDVPVEESVEETVEETPVETADTTVKTEKPITMVNAPVVPKIL